MRDHDDSQVNFVNTVESVPSWRTHSNNKIQRNNMTVRDARPLYIIIFRVIYVMSCNAVQRLSGQTSGTSDLDGDNNIHTKLRHRETQVNISQN